MAEIVSGASLPNEQRCKRSDGRGWRCRQPVAEGKGYCEAHIQQAQLRQKRQPVPDHLKLKHTPKLERESDDDIVSEAPVPRKRAKVVKLEMGTMEIPPADSSSEPRHKAASPAVKVGAPTTSSDLRRPIRSKNSEPIPIPVVKSLPGIKENIKASTKEKINKKKIVEQKKIIEQKKIKEKIVKKCHWCRLTGFCVLIKCLTCKKNFFCEECIDKRFYCKKTIERECPVCQGECSCRACTKGKPKQVTTKEPVIYDVDKDVTICDLEKEMTVSNQEKMSDFEKNQLLHLIRVLLPVISKMNEEKITELDTEARNKGVCHGGLEVQIAGYTEKKECSLTKDLEESAKRILCTFQPEKLNEFADSSPCSLCGENVEAGVYFCTKQDLKGNHLQHFIKHWGKGQPIFIRDVFQTQPDLDWDFGFILCEYLKKSAESRDHTKTGSANSTRDWCEVEFGRKQIFSRGITHENAWNEFLKFKLRFSSDFLQDHFPDHHNAIMGSLPIQEYMNPYTGFMNLGANSPHQTKSANLGSYVSMSYGGLGDPMDANLLLNLCIHAHDVVNVLVHATGCPIPESSLNKVKMLVNKYNSQDINHEVDLVSDESESESDDEDHLVSDESESESDDEDHLVSDESELESDGEALPEAGISCGAHWDIFRREDVPMLVEYLRKYSDKLSRSHGSPKQVIHPLYDEVFYLDDDHKTRLRDEFNVQALSFKQHVGEAVIIPAGCPYQIRKIKSCVNVVHEFMSPESALESIKVSDEVRSLPVRHKAKGNMVQVKEMAISRMQAAIEAMREAFVSQPEWSWPSAFSHSVKPP